MSKERSQSNEFAKDFCTNGIVESFPPVFEFVSNFSGKCKDAVVYEVVRCTGF